MVQVAGDMFARREHAFERIRFQLERLFARPEPIEVVEQRYNFLPQRFRWRGNTWRVRRVVRIWDYEHNALMPPRRYFRVLCQDDAAHTVFQDLRLGTWHMSV